MVATWLQFDTIKCSHSYLCSDYLKGSDEITCYWYLNVAIKLRNTSYDRLAWLTKPKHSTHHMNKYYFPIQEGL